MTAKNSLVHVRIDEDLKDQAAAVLAEYGLNVSDATRILLTRIAKEGTVPPILLASKSDYDTWFREKIQEAMNDPRPGIPHAQVMAEIRETLDCKTRSFANAETSV